MFNSHKRHGRFNIWLHANTPNPLRKGKGVERHSCPEASMRKNSTLKTCLISPQGEIHGCPWVRITHTLVCQAAHREWNRAKQGHSHANRSTAHVVTLLRIWRYGSRSSREQHQIYWPATILSLHSNRAENNSWLGIRKGSIQWWGRAQKHCWFLRAVWWPSVFWRK